MTPLKSDIAKSDTRYRHSLHRALQRLKITHSLGFFVTFAGGIYGELLVELAMPVGVCSSTLGFTAAFMTVFGFAQPSFPNLMLFCCGVIPPMMPFIGLVFLRAIFSASFLNSLPIYLGVTATGFAVVAGCVDTGLTGVTAGFF